MPAVRHAAIALVLFVTATVNVPRAHSQQPAAADPVISSTSQEVLLDVVVRDKRGRPIKDLKPSDFEITDDGAAQRIKAFRLISGAEAAPPPQQAPNAPKAEQPARATVDPLRQIRLVTIVFERLGTEGRVLARQAVDDLLKSDDSPNLLFAVFSIDQRLSILQQYTNDRPKVKKAVDRILGSQSSIYISESDKIEQELKIEATMDTASAAVPTNSNGAPDGFAAAAGALAQMQLDMMQFNQTVDRTQQGRSTIFGLMALMQEQYRLPGRKTILYFTEGMYVPPEYKNDFETLIGQANRFNVSFYGIDARGLTTINANGGADSVLSQAARSSRTMQTNRSGPVTRDQATAGDRSEDAIRSNVITSLADLSEGTGGFLIANSNDLKGQLRRVTEDIDTHYEISYAPAIEKFDGHFRRVTVKVDRADARIQTRSGYFALPFTAGKQVNTWELPMLTALSTAPAPRNVPYRSSALSFRNPDGKARSEIVVDVPLEGIQFDRDEAAKVYRVHFSVLALVKDAQGAIQKKLSVDVPRQGPLDRIDGFRAGHFIYSQPVDLPPGRYTLETAVYDFNATKSAAKKAVLLVPATAKGPSISSLALVRSVAQPAPGEHSSDPLEFDGGKVTPSLDDSIKQAGGGTLSFYFNIYPAPGSGTQPTLTLEYLQDGKVVGKGEPKLPAPDNSGRIPYIASSPLEGFKPGQYEILATVRQDGQSATEHTFVTIE